MTKQKISTVFLALGAALAVIAPAHADSLFTSASTAEYQSAGYDFSSPDNDPPAAYQNIGTFMFTPILAADVSSITMSGTFGLPFPFPTTTALSDYYLGDATDAGGEAAVEVAACDSTVSNPQPDCYAGDEGPYSWSFTLD